MEFNSVDNLTLEECLEENFGKTIFDCSRCFTLKNRPPWQLYVHAIIIAIIIVLTIVGNGIILLLVLKYKKLRQRTTLVSLNIVFANSILVLSYHLPTLISTVSSSWSFGFRGCQAFGFLSTDFVITRWFTMAVLAFDRFCAVKFPFSYLRHNKKIITLLLSASWIIPIILSITTVAGYVGVAFRPNVPTCLLYAPAVGKGRLFISIVLSFSFIVGGILPIFMYIWMFHKARKLRKSMFNVGKINNSKESIINDHDMSMNSARERRAMFTFALIFISFCLTGLPGYLFQVVRSVSFASWCKIPHMIHFMVIQLYLSSTALDPFLVMRDRDIRKRLKHLFCCHNNCGKYYSYRSNIHPEMAHSRDFDAIRSVAAKALNLVSPMSLREACDTSQQSIQPLAHTHRPRSGSAPAIYFSGKVSRPPVLQKQLAMLKEKVREEEIREEGSGRHAFITKKSGIGDISGMQRNEIQVEVHGESKNEVIYSDLKRNRECIQVSIAFDE